MMSDFPGVCEGSQFSETLSGGGVRCHLCSHRCQLELGELGFCRVRQNQNGQLVALNYGRVIAWALDPIEKKPLVEFRPGTNVLTFATPGCNFRCRFCQNWEISQIGGVEFLKDLPLVMPSELVKRAKLLEADGLACSYTEPAIFGEYALDVMRLSHQAKLFNVWHTSGYLTPEARWIFMPLLDAVCVDYKAAFERTHRWLTGARLKPVLDTMRAFREAGVWLEVATPLIPDLNDDDVSLIIMARFIAEELGPGTPWHLQRFHPAWQMLQGGFATRASLRRALQAAKDVGLTNIVLDFLWGKVRAQEISCERDQGILSR